MIKNYFKIALRNMIKNGVFSFINIFGLAVGFTCCFLIGIYIRHEFSYDKYHVNGARIYRLASQIHGSSYQNGIAKVGELWGPEAKQSIPEIADYARFKTYGQALIKQGSEQIYQEGGFFADRSVFKIFSWKLINGDPATALTEPNSLVLTQSLADKLFKGINPVGKTVTIDNNDVYKVTGVMQDPPPASHFDFSFFISITGQNDNTTDGWTRNQFYTYLLLKPGTSPALIEKKMKNVLAANLDTAQARLYTPFLQPLTDIHLHSNLFREISPNSDMTTVYIFGVIAIIILSIACMNFINLTTAKAANRAKEVGIRKTNGAARSNLIKQFILESLLVGIIAGVAAFIITFVLINPFSALMGRELNFAIAGNGMLYILLFGLIIFTCIISSIYPAFILSSFKPVKVLKGNFTFKSNAVLRSTLVVFQFSLSIALIIAVLVIGTQMKYMRQKDLGFNKDQVLTIPLKNKEKGLVLDRIMDRIKTIPGVLSVSASSNQPGGSDWGMPYQPIGVNTPPSMRCLVVDEDFFKTYNIKIAAGRGFSKELSTDSSAYLINETAARELGWKDPLKEQIAMPAIGRKPGAVIGVVKDFNYHSLHEAIQPLFIFMKKDWFSQVNIKIDEMRTASVLSSLKLVWSEAEPEFPFTYTFLDEQFKAFYESEQKTSELLSWFTIIAITISCLGLYALSTLMARQKIKEIGIRKVLGASISGIVGMLAKKFIKPVIIALAIASPVAWYFMNKWLSDFAYRADISWKIFAVTTFLAIIIALLTVSMQAIKAAVANPVKSLRSE